MPAQFMGDGDEKDLALEIAHLLFIDVVGYSKLIVNEQIELMQRLNRIVRETECFREAEAKEELVRLPTGDGMVLLFSRSPEQPARCALQITEALREHAQVQIRMGIHSGPVNRVLDVNDQTNIAGAGINIGQRVMDCGDSGHILLSKHVADDLIQYRHWRPYLRDLGECEVKHGLRLHIVSLSKDGLGNSAVPQKLRRDPWWKSKRSNGNGFFKKAALLLAVAGLVVGFWIFFGGHLNRPAGKSAVAEKSIAVLRFENRSEEKNNSYFADGVQDEILTLLSKIGTLKVISRTSTQQYESAPANLPEIARQLGVAYILEGSVEKRGQAVRVNVQLIKASSDSHVWAETFDRELTDVFLVESDVAKAIADQLSAKLTGREERLMAAKPTNNPDAYDAYLRGLAYTVKAGTTSANSLGAQRNFQEAVRLDAKFALGWALLSYTDSIGYLTTALPPTDALKEESRKAAEMSVILEPHLGEGALAWGEYYYACLKDYQTAVRYFEEARQLLPNSSRIAESLAYVARRQGNWDKSEAYFNEAERLDPRNPNVLAQHALFYVALRRFPEALRKCDQVLDITPDDLDTLALKAGVAQAEGDLSRASAILAALQPTATDVGPLETQAYQSILERRSRPIIPRLQGILVNPDPAGGYFNGQLRFWLGWTQDVTGDRAAALQSWRQARDEMKASLHDQPENDLLLGDLALVEMALQNKAAAISLAERAVAANPMEKDAIAGPGPMEILARVAASAGEKERAISLLGKLLTRPYAGGAQNVPLTPALLRLDPTFDALRSDARFQKLAQAPRR